MSRSFWKGFAACYAIGAVAFGVVAYRAMPFVNMAGDAYYGILWPLTPLSVATGVDLYPIPEWAFAKEARS